MNPIWHRMLYSCTHMATVGVRGLLQRHSCALDDWDLSNLAHRTVHLRRSMQQHAWTCRML